jgi:RNA polymerase sigma factor (sigma-70 family)
MEGDRHLAQPPGRPGASAIVLKRCNAEGLLRHCLDMDVDFSSQAAERRFTELFDHLGLVIAYARRRGGIDPDATAAEVMTVAWRRLPTVPDGDPRPWLIATARNLLMNEWRRQARERAAVAQLDGDDFAPAPTLGLDPILESALRQLSLDDREALILVAWEEFTPSEAAQSLGISATAFRVRLYRARRRQRVVLGDAQLEQPIPHPTTRSTHV